MKVSLQWLENYLVMYDIDILLLTGTLYCC